MREGKYTGVRNYHPEFNYDEFALIKSKVGFYHSIHLHNNSKLENVFFKSGVIEAWGKGFEKIKEACKYPKSTKERMLKFNLEHSYFRRHYLEKMLELGNREHS